MFNAHNQEWKVFTLGRQKFWTCSKLSCWPAKVTRMRITLFELIVIVIVIARMTRNDPLTEHEFSIHLHSAVDSTQWDLGITWDMSVFELPGGVTTGGVLLIIAGNTGDAWLQSIVWLSRLPWTWQGLIKHVLSSPVMSAFGLSKHSSKFYLFCDLVTTPSFLKEVALFFWSLFYLEGDFLANELCIPFKDCPPLSTLLNLIFCWDASGRAWTPDIVATSHTPHLVIYKKAKTVIIFQLIVLYEKNVVKIPLV